MKTKRAVPARSAGTARVNNYSSLTLRRVTLWASCVLVKFIQIFSRNLYIEVIPIKTTWHKPETAFCTSTSAQINRSKTCSQVTRTRLIHIRTYTYRVFEKKNAQSLRITIMQPHVTESCGFQKNVQKEIVHATKASVWIWQLNILCFAAGKWTIWKEN